MANNNDQGRLLVIAAHPDDEILGCGGTVAKLVAAGWEAQSVIACEGHSHRGIEQEDDGEHYAEKAAAVLGVSKVHQLAFPDQKLDTLCLTDVITPLEKIIDEYQPSVLLVQYGGDLNRDHELLFKAVMVAARPTVPCIEAIYAFDTASSTEWAYPRSFSPDTWVDISDFLDKKLDAMACYKTELMPYPHPRSLDGLRYKAHSWGNQACMDAAEVFVTVQRRIRNGKAPL
jgi:LmbE family N-acetylglucosaminyl deacetylase